MNRPLIILLLGILIAVAGFWGIYYSRTADTRALLASDIPELAWLKHEFNLSDAEFKRISELHESYLPRCADMCRRIAEKNSEIGKAIVASERLTSEIETKLREAAELRAECQAAMLKHFFEVSQTMPAEQGRRYLEWVQEKTFPPDHGLMAH